jgi:hypothetical protein
MALKGRRRGVPMDAVIFWGYGDDTSLFLACPAFLFFFRFTFHTDLYKSMLNGPTNADAIRRNCNETLCIHFGYSWYKLENGPSSW